MKFIMKILILICTCGTCYIVPAMIGEKFMKEGIPLFMFWGGMLYMLLSRVIMED